MDPKTLAFLMGAAGGASKLYVEDVFSTWLYTGNGSTQTITNGIDLSGKGGLVWIKSRNAGFSHQIYDTSRGAGNVLFTNGSDGQFSRANGCTSFNSNGFSLGTDATSNELSTNFASWTFRKAPKFFDVVTYTGIGGVYQSINHNLGSAPGCIIAKRADNTGDWFVYHRSLNDASNSYLLLNSTSSRTSGLAWGGSTPTSTSFDVESNLNTSNGTYVAYLFAHDAGGFGDSGNDSVISCGSYTGNGSATGPTVTLGWEPQWLLIKRTDGVGDWNLIDNMRGFVSNGTDAELNPNLSVSESTGTFVSPLSTGFQLNTTDTGYNASGGGYMYIAIRRGPMKTPTDATKVFSANAYSGVTGDPITTGFPIDLQIVTVRGITSLRYWVDKLRGVITNNTNATSPHLQSNGTDAETNNTSITRNWNNTGFDVPQYLSSNSQVSWNFRRVPGFFDVVAYTGTGSAGNTTHNLGVKPELVILKARATDTGASNGFWGVVATNEPEATCAGYLNSTETFSPSTNKFGSTFSSSATTFSRTTYYNSSSITYIAYLFASCPGVSKVGRYTGTGTTLNVDCGFTNGARFVLIKRTDSTGDWYVWDTARGIVSGNDPYLLLNSTTAEVTNTDYIDPLNSGFQISSTAPAAINASGGTFIFLAIA